MVPYIPPRVSKLTGIPCFGLANVVKITQVHTCFLPSITVRPSQRNQMKFLRVRNQAKEFNSDRPSKEDCVTNIR